MQMPLWREQYEGVENMTVAVMGCVVNGPGESKLANIGISLPGTGESPAAPVYIDGEKAMTLRGDNIAGEFTGIVDEYVARKYVKRNPPQSPLVRGEANSCSPDKGRLGGVGVIELRK